MPESKVTPKQFRHWLRVNGIRSVGRCKWTRNSIFKGWGRHWRVTYDNQFDMSEKFEDFDRWANSCEATVVRLPKTLKEANEMFGILRELERLPPAEYTRQVILSDVAV